ncbi:SGNH/GDSL hydrolase family protein [Patescibacteria group bacterium]
MNLLALFSIAVFASEAIVSPLPDNFSAGQYQITSIQDIKAASDQATFGDLINKEISIDSEAVLGEQTADLINPESENSTSSNTLPRNQVQSKSIKIAMLGDSMVDTLGPGLPHLESELQKIYPTVNFSLFNHGVGATNIDYGLQRIANDYTYLGTNITSLVSNNPDIVIIESFAYNPFSYDEGALDHHWLSLAKAVDSINNHLPNASIMIASTIAPNNTVFGDGAPSVFFSAEDKRARTNNINKYLDNAVKFALSQNLPLANAYTPSIGPSGTGKLEYINAGDHIHYSDSGRIFFSQIIAQTIYSNNLIQ